MNLEFFTGTEDRMKKLFIAALVALAVSSAEAGIISADADGYANNTDISAAFSGITLSVVGSYTGLDGQVYAWGDGLASTGTNVFANSTSFQRQWYADVSDGFAFRADFSQYASKVTIDIIGDDSGDVGVLMAYNSSGTLLDSITSPQLNTGAVYTAIIDRVFVFDIAYIIAGGSIATEDAVHLDNLTANVPEPFSLCLFGVGSLFLAKGWQKSVKSQFSC
jgi:hypothetical protein